MKKLFIIISCFCLVSCNNKEIKHKTASPDQNAHFDKYKETFVESLWRLYPGWASGIGYHKYDSILTIPNQQNRDKLLAFSKANLDSLKTFDINKLSDNNKTDYYMLENSFNETQWSFNTFKSYEWNPAAYNVCGEFAEMLANNYDSLDIRLENFYLKLNNVSAYYEAAKQNIKNPTAEHTQLAIDQNIGGASIFSTDLNEALTRSKLSDEKKIEIKARATTAIEAITDYASWLKQLENKEARSFRIGAELFKKKFEFDIMSGYSADQIYEKALEHKKELHVKMLVLTKELWPKYLKDKKMPEDNMLAIREMIDVLSTKHVKPDSFQLAIEKQIPELVEFIKRNDLITLDPTKPLVVRKEPAYMAGTAGASISSPGPYDKNGNTYYNVGSFGGWDKARIESYLREYNHYILQILNIHEAIPGHYTQLIYSNQSPSIIKSIFGNGAMVEGWAVYTELMMLENGYGASAGSAQASPEMWLMYYKWNLRSTCNTILDYSIHTKNLNKEEALNFLMNEAFQQKAEAEGKWKRASLSQVQLCSYFTGYTEIYDLREELKKKQGDKFNLKAFHEKFLSYGSAPVKLIRELMLKEN
ncbi:MAG: DUF885 domain-containing protein [Bacteroidetes bacterium]|nr:DUF885 domain-containing protein [Bacteroidota bacterium]